MTAEGRRTLWLLVAAAAILAAIIHLSGCSTVQPETPKLRRWAHESALIIIDHKAPDCFFWAVRDALDLLRPRVNVTVEKGLANPPRPGEIVVRWRQPTHGLGLTTAWVDDRYVYRAIVDVPECRLRLVAHELGHAFGLANTMEPERLMTTRYSNGWFAMTIHERAALRRVTP